MTTSAFLGEISSKAFFTADHADAVNGKVYVNGGFWNRWRSASYPQVFPPLAVVAVLDVPFAQYHRDHKIIISLVDADEKEQPLRAEGIIRVGADPSMDYGESSLVPFAANFANVLIPSAGTYSFVLSVDGAELDRFQVKAMQLPEMIQFGAADDSDEDDGLRGSESMGLRGDRLG
jgi:hypothetical protein